MLRCPLLHPLPLLECPACDPMKCTREKEIHPPVLKKSTVTLNNSGQTEVFKEGRVELDHLVVFCIVILVKSSFKIMNVYLAQYSL